MRVLGLDLQARRLGWAVVEGDGALVAAGLVLLGQRRERGPSGRDRWAHVPALRCWDLRHELQTLLDTYQPEVVAYEDIPTLHQHASADSAHGWGAAQASMAEVVYRHALARQEVKLAAVGVQGAKRALTGSGAARKPAMALAAAARWPVAMVDWSAGDHDAADAAGVALAIVAPVESQAAAAKRRRAARAAKGAA